MRKRPLCLAALILIAVILLAHWLGVSWIWRSPGGVKPDIWAESKGSACVEGIVYRQEEQQFSNHTYTYLYLKHTSLFIESETYPIRNIKCIVENETESLLGFRVSISGTLTLPDIPGNPGEFDQKAYERARKIDFHLEKGQVRGKVREKQDPAVFFAAAREGCIKILEEIFPQKQAGVLEAMLLGDKKQLDAEVKGRYQAAGISHIIAISGLHISLLGMAVRGAMKRLGMPQVLSAGISLALLSGYGMLIGNPTTAFRALLMFGIMMGAGVLGRAYDLLSALAAAGILLLADNPDLLSDCGFQLSFMAVLGIGIAGKLPKKWTGVFLWFFTLPVVLHAFYQVSLIGLLCNLLILPLMPGVLGSGAAALILGKWNITVGSIAGIPAYGLLCLYEWLGTAAEKIPFGIWTPGQPSGWAIVIYYAVFATAWKIRERSRWIPCGAAVMLLILMAAPWENTREITTLDVGQGDGIVIQADGVCAMIDGGSSSKSQVGTYVILPYLKQQGISRLNGIFLTHTDQDHINGVETVLEEAKKGWFSVEFLWMPVWMEETEEGRKMEQKAEASGISCRYLKAGDQVRMGEMEITILHPGKEDYTEMPNEGSMVISLELGGWRGVFTGDLPEGEEKDIVEQAEKSDVLKVGHHGSKGSSSTVFLEKIQPQIALISCGENNRYGHPGKETLERLSRVGSRVFRTDRQGALTIRIKNKREWEAYGWRGKEIFLAQSDGERYTE